MARMEDQHFQSFSDFEEWIRSLKEQQSIDQKDNPLNYSELLFRGHADESWELLTTLEREHPEISTVDDYLYCANRIKLQVELYTGRKWLPIINEKGELIKKNEFGFRASLPSIEYLVYLRHHGFPSPILDWSRSPYIAALFAYAGCQSVEGENIAIFVHQEFCGEAKLMSSDRFIQGIGSYIDTHKRHSIQQSQYTLCLAQNSPLFITSDYSYSLYSHEDYRKSHTSELCKITLPKEEKYKILAKFDQFNLNLHSLYGSEEALMSTLALREFHLK